MVVSAGVTSLAGCSASLLARIARNISQGEVVAGRRARPLADASAGAARFGAIATERGGAGVRRDRGGSAVQRASACLL